MERVQRLCAQVGTPVNLFDHLPANAYTLAYAEKDLPGKSGNAYALGGTFRQRIQVAPVALRQAWARACAASSGTDKLLEEMPAFPLVELEYHGQYGALTSQLKTCYGDRPTQLARVAMDIDGRDNSKPFPTAADLFAVCARMLQENTENAHNIQWEKEPAAVFFLSMPGKERSAHVYFLNACFDPSKDNVLGKAHALTDVFNELLEPCGMQGDFSICNSGLRWEFGNKFPPNKSMGRNRVAVPTFFNCAQEWDWLELASVLDPHVLVSDPCWERRVSWIIPADARPARRVAVGEGNAPDHNVVANAPAAEKALFAQVPELIGVTTKRIQQAEGVIKLVPQTTYCPFKVLASDDQPAHHHSAPKLYAFCYPNGFVNLLCGVCTGKRLAIQPLDPPDDVIQGRVIESLNKQWARLGPANVMRYPALLPDGGWVPVEVLTPPQFFQAVDNLNPKIKVGKRNFTEGQFWYASPASTRFRYGTIFDPSYTADGNYYNTYRGFNPLVLAKAAEVGIDEWQHTKELIEQNICGGDATAAAAVFGFFVDLIQNPGRKPGWGICIFGPQGCGKGLTSQFFAKIIGKAHTCVLDASALESQYNFRMMESLLVIAEEAVAAKEEKTINMLKAYVTEEQLPVRQKYRDEKESKTFMRIVMLSNSDAPVVIEDRDRRWLVLDAGYHLGDDRDPRWRQKIADLVEERDSLTGPASFYKWALQHDNSRFDPRVPVHTRARWTVRQQRFNDYERFVYRFLCTGVVCRVMTEDSEGCHRALAKQYGCDTADLGSKVWEESVPKKLVYCGLTEISRSDKATESGLWKFLFSFTTEDEWSPHRVHLGPYRCRVVKFPSRDRLKKAFATKLGQPMKIFDAWAIE